MNQSSYQALTKMLNAFPQSAADLRGLLLTYDQALSGVCDQAICEAAQRFVSGDVKAQSLTFAPSIAEFVKEARRIAEVLPYRGRRQISVPFRERYREPDQQSRVRMGFKMDVLSAALARCQAERVAEANKRGLDDMIALAQEWSVPVPGELWAQIGRG